MEAEIVESLTNVMLDRIVALQNEGNRLIDKIDELTTKLAIAESEIKTLKSLPENPNER